jgi:hypothetical protein
MLWDINTFSIHLSPFILLAQRNLSWLSSLE